MDNSHVALVSMMLKAEGFSPYRCDRNIPLGINLTSLTKVLRCAQNGKILTISAVAIEASKEGVKFTCVGDIGSGSVTLRGHTNVEKPELNVEIELTEPVALTFSLKYLVNFCKASSLSSTVKLCLSNE